MTALSESECSVIDLHVVKIACFLKKEIVFAISKAADLNWLVQGGQHYLKEKTQCGWPPHWDSLVGQKGNNVYNIKSNWSKLVGKRRTTLSER